MQVVSIGHLAQSPGWEWGLGIRKGFLEEWPACLDVHLYTEWSVLSRVSSRGHSSDKSRAVGCSVLLGGLERMLICLRLGNILGFTSCAFFTALLLFLIPHLFG